MDFNQLMQEIVNEPYENLVRMARQAITELCPYFEDIADGDAEKGTSVVVGYIAASLAADCKLTQKEYEFVCDVLQTDYTYDDVKDLAQRGLDDAMVAALDELIDDLPNEMKSKVLLLCCTFMAADETISRDEVQLVYKLMKN